MSKHNRLYERYFSSKAFPFFNMLFILIIGNILFVTLNFFTLIVFTLFPSSIALLIIIRSAREDTDFPLFKAFFKIFTKEYLKSQLLFLCFLGIGLFLGLGVYILQFAPNSILFILSKWFIYLLIFISALAIIHTIPIYVYFPHLTIRGIVKYSYLLGIGLLFQSIGLLLLYGLSISILIIFPAFGTLIGFLILFSLLTYLTIKMLENKYLSLDHDTNPLTITHYLPEY